MDLMDADGFRDEVRACAEEIGALLPQLALRHSPLIVLAALSEHVGGGLLRCQQAGVCTPEEARTLLAELEEAVFADPDEADDQPRPS